MYLKNICIILFNNHQPYENIKDGIYLTINKQTILSAGFHTPFMSKHKTFGTTRLNLGRSVATFELFAHSMEHDC